MKNTPELLIPAGSLEKLKVACLYGADAVYLGGQKFGLRAASDNFTESELREGLEFAHNHNVLVHVVLNSFLHDKDIDELAVFLKFLDSIKVDALIISDLGVIKTAQKYTSIPIHLSTQASCLNIASAKLWKQIGVKRVILGREASLRDGAMIKEATGLEVEMFIHGSMCMAYSGNCTISNYTAGRDSNRGGCAHSCRFEYSMDLSKIDTSLADNKKTFFMSSKDLMGLSVIDDYIRAGIDSVKIEGRMKSSLYAASVAKVYREAIDSYRDNKQLDKNQVSWWEAELQKMGHRDQSLASLKTPAGADTIFDSRDEKKNDYKVAGLIVDTTKDKMIVDVRFHFGPQTLLELLPLKGAPIEFKAKSITNLKGELIEKTKPSTWVSLPLIKGAQKFSLIRQRLV